MANGMGQMCPPGVHPDRSTVYLTTSGSGWCLCFPEAMIDRSVKIMKKQNKIYRRLLCLLLTLAMAVATLAGCAPAEPSVPTAEPSSGSATNGSYAVSLKTLGGMSLSGIDVYIYADDSLSELVNFGKTDDNGLVSFTLPEKEGYAIALSGVPKGYDVQPSYAFRSGTAVITLQSAPVQEDLSNASLRLGSVMYDFSLTDIDGNTVTLSQILQEKKMAMLNFWYTGCSWCWTEFPVMAEAYEQYSDRVGIVAVDPMETDSKESIIATLAEKQLDLPFTVARCPYAWANSFSVMGYPTTVIIDRYGVICMIESGAITSKGAWINIFEYFTAEDYTQKLVENASDLVVQTKPTYTMEDEKTVADALGAGELPIHFYPSEGEYAWPFLTGDKNGASCVYASNRNIDSSYAILCADVELKAGQALGLDYFAATETGADILHIIVNDEDMYRISGTSTDWTAVYPCVADQDGTYRVTFSYVKDDSTNTGDDTVYLKNLRIVDAAQVDVPTYLPREAAVSTDGFTFTYADIVLNETDGYYHVGSPDGALLLANLTAGPTQLNEADAPYLLAQARGELLVDGQNRFDTLERYASYASNATITGYCPVTPELAVCLQALAKVEGFDPNDPNEWLKMCRYYAAYGTGGAQLDNPIAGVDNFCAFTAKLGKNIETNRLVYDRVVYPRGLRAGFTPERSGVYRITSRSNSAQGVDGWLFGENGDVLMVYEPDERMYDGEEVSMVYYMQAGSTYYLSIAFWDLYEEGTIYYDIEYLGASLELFRLASPAVFTYAVDEITGELLYTIAGGIDVVLGPDGIWYEDLGLDATGKQRYGGKLYVDFTGSNGLFSNPIMSYGDISGMIDLGGFDFRKNEADEYILSILRAQNQDVEATLAYLKEKWEDSYKEYYESYQVEDVLAGRYHGTGEDLTEAMRAYAAKIDTSSHVERNGCVVATKELTDILQQLMDKYTFQGVENSWRKLCYYYDYLGPEK